MKIKEGGGMDVQEKKAFEIAFDNKLGARGCQFDLDEDGNYEDRETLCGWHMWLEAKAQAVPDLSELQERIAGHQYYHDKHGHMIVDMDDVVKEISGFDSWKAQAVPEGFAVVPIEITPKQIEAYMKGKVFPASMGEHRKFVERLSKDYKAMIEAQEQAND